MVSHFSSDDSGGMPLVPPCFFMSASHEKGLRFLEAWECVCKAMISVRKIVEPVLTVSELTTLKWKCVHFWGTPCNLPLHNIHPLLPLIMRLIIPNNWYSFARLQHYGGEFSGAVIMETLQTHQRLLLLMLAGKVQTKLRHSPSGFLIPFSAMGGGMIPPPLGGTQGRE